MTDIDAIRKAKRYERYFDGMREERKGRYVTAIILDAALAAYDAKCEELATGEREFQAMFKEAVKCKEERDAAVSLLRECRPIVFADHIREVGTRVLARYTLTARIDAQLSALAPPTEQPTEQPCSLCGGTREVNQMAPNLLPVLCPRCQPNERGVMP